MKTIYSNTAGGPVPFRDIKFMSDDEYKKEAERQAKKHPEMYRRAMKDAEEMRKNPPDIPTFYDRRGTK